MRERHFASPKKLLVIIMLLSGAILSLQQPSQATAEPVKLGYTISLTGVYTALGIDLRDGLNLYMDEIGHKAGGRDIKVIVEDIGSNEPSRALDVARKLVEKEHIDILAGVVGTGSAYALAEFVPKHNIPFVISNAGADDLTQRKNNPYIVRPAFVNSGGSHPLGEWVYDKGYRKAVLMGADYGAGYEHVGGIAKTFTNKGGKVIQEIWTPLGTKDYAPYLAKIDRDADVVLVFFAGADALRFVIQYADYGLKEKIALVGKGYLVDDNILEKQAKAAEGVVTESHWCLLLDTPENNKFVDAYKKKYGHSPTLYSEQGYLTAKLIAEALNKTGGKIDGKQFVEVMRSIELNAPRGIVKFDKFGAPIQNSYIREVKRVDGSWQNVPIETYTGVNQFWKWSPEEFMKMPSYSEMKGKWVQ